MINILLIGPQGSGKGTQALRIIKDFELHYIEMGELIRRRATMHDDKGMIIDHLANKKGILLPDGIVMDMIYDELENNPTDTGYLFDGFPRTATQYNALKEIGQQKNITITHAFFIHISDSTAIKRLTLRRTCEKCNTRHIAQNNKDTCPCGGNLIQRPDDTPTLIKKRLEQYHTSTQPVLDLLKQEKLLTTINGNRSVDEVYTEIRKYI